MEEVCQFIINGNVYTIYDVDKITGKENYVGRSHYEDRTIYIEKGNFEDMMLTLKHELMHVWLYENGHTMDILIKMEMKYLIMKICAN